MALTLLGCVRLHFAGLCLTSLGLGGLGLDGLAVAPIISRVTSVGAGLASSDFLVSRAWELPFSHATISLGIRVTASSLWGSACVES